MDHSQPDYYSRATYRGALQGENTHSVRTGNCLTRETADDTGTYELDRNFVFTRGAKAGFVPNLEIESGETAGVGHTSAIGRFDDKQLFHLMSHDISEIDARGLIVGGFFAELINQTGVPEIVDHLMESVETGLAEDRN